jgi:hypothetical protein
MNQIILKIRKGIGKIELSNLLLKKGGGFLGQIRFWIQFNFLNGSDVTWGSDDFLRKSGSFTVREVEHSAADIAAAVLQDFEQNLVTDAEKRALAVYKNPVNWDGDTFAPKEGLHFSEPYCYNGGSFSSEYRSWQIGDSEEMSYSIQTRSNNDQN